MKYVPNLSMENDIINSLSNEKADKEYLVNECRKINYLHWYLIFNFYILYYFP